MTLYNSLVFLHIVCATALFVSLAIEWTTLSRFDVATDIEAELRAVVRAVLAGLACVVAVAASGGMLAAMAWGRTGWIGAGMFPLLPLAGLSAAVTLRKVLGIRARWRRAERRDSRALRVGLRSVSLQMSLRTRAGIALGIVYVMVAKPSLGGGLLAVVAFVAAGFVSALPCLRGRHDEPQSTQGSERWHESTSDAPPTW